MSPDGSVPAYDGGVPERTPVPGAWLRALLPPLIVLAWLAVLARLGWPDYAQQAQLLQPLVESLLTPLGVQPGWVAELQRQMLAELQTAATAVARDLIPRIAEFFGTVVDLVLVLILSIYLCSNGARIAEWLRTQLPGQ